MSAWPFLQSLLAGALEIILQLALLGVEVTGKGYLEMMDVLAGDSNT